MKTRLPKRLTCTILLLLALLLVPVANAATITVNSTADNLTGGDGKCTLREAIMNANSDSDTTGGDCIAGTGTDTIMLPAGTYTLTITGTGEDANATGDLDITDLDGLSILGDGADVTIIQAGTSSPVSGTCTDCVDRVMQHHIIADLNLEGLTLRHGLLGPSSGFLARGPGLRIKTCNLVTVTDVTFTNNFASSRRGLGGGIDANSCELTVTRSAFVNNRVEGENTTNMGEGGGIFLFGSPARLENVTISGNTSNGFGGGLMAAGSIVVEVINSTIVDNHTTETVPPANFSGQGGGGVLSASGATIRLQNTIVVGNTDMERPPVGTTATDDCGVNSGGSVGFITSLGYNLVGAGTGCPTSGTGDLTTASPASEVDLTLALNGGTTPNHALVAGSQALDHIPNGTNGCGTTITDDQRGVNRPDGSACDVGSVEGTAVTDTDGDGVDDDDLCPDTVMPEENVPTLRLGTNRWVLGDDGIFDTTPPKGKGPNRSYTIEDTHGCSCEQIIDLLDLGKGHTKFGCSISAMDDAVNFVSSAPKRGAGADATEVAGVPEAYVLEANYPNPFNPQTTIRFSVPESAQVRLVVYDVLGREVRVLVDGTREAGTHEVVFEASNLPSGTYLVRLETPAGSFVQTMQLVK